MEKMVLGIWVRKGIEALTLSLNKLHELVFDSGGALDQPQAGALSKADASKKYSSSVAMSRRKR